MTRFLIASGPTQEPLDPVRFLSNFSTGTMGRHLAQAARRQKHRVTWVECPRDAQTAVELERKLKALLPKNDVLIMAAAVCDARPARVSPTKLKKGALSAIRLVKNPDILATLAKKKRKDQVFIGFGLESEKILANGLEKLRRKGLELIVLQKVTKDKTPFGEKSIEAFILKKNGNVRRFGAISKRKLADFLVREAEAGARGKKRDGENPF
ncbi:MAG: phosphopantothenoylcysteine decarboxylase [Candidatus Omnitrophota bacterium]